MSGITIGLFIIGGIVSIIGGFMLIIAAFRQSAAWGLGTMFVPFVGLIFLIKFWNEAKRAFFWSLAGGGLYLLAFLIVVATVVSEPVEQRADPQDHTPASASDESLVYEPRFESSTTTQLTAERRRAAAEAAAWGAVSEEPEPPKIEQVYVDNTTRLYYSESCGKRPENTYKVGRSVAVMQGYQDARCTE